MTREASIPAPFELPSELPDGRALVTEGQRIGEGIETGTSAYCARYGVRSEALLRAERAEAGELTWSMIMGLSTMEEQVRGLRYLDRLGRRSGMAIDRGLVIPNWLSGLPPELRTAVPKGTSFVLDGLEDHIRIAQAAPIQPCFNDWHIGSPYCLQNTANAIIAGGSYHGVLAQFAWSMPLVDDDVAHLAENVRAIGVVAAKRDDWQVVDSYMDDGLPSRFLDNVSLVGYALLERYVVEELCGARYATGFGGLVSDIPTKIAVWLALHAVLKAEHPCLSYLYGNTITPSDRWTTQNFGIVASEFAFFGAVERRYRTGVAFLPTPATEKLKVPTRQAIGQARLVAGRAVDHARSCDRLLDWSQLEAQRDVLAENGRVFFGRTIALLDRSQVDVRDPLQVLLALRRMGAHNLEQLCHPGDQDDRGDIVPLVPTELLSMTQHLIARELRAINAAGNGQAVRECRFVVASADTHWYGVHALSSVLTELGAEVLDLGADVEPGKVVAAAACAEWPAIAVSAHNGQCLEYAAQLVDLLNEYGACVPVYVGGKLNAILGEETEPRDMTDPLRELGVIPCATIAALVDHAAVHPRARSVRD
jgi:methylmalonyl-CoA mutase cobalamin-binding subunit